MRLAKSVPFRYRDNSEGDQMLYTKACPRCSGDVKLDRDNYGVYAKCLQCGFNRDFQTRRGDMPMSSGTGSLFGPEVIFPDLPEEDEQLEAA